MDLLLIVALCGIVGGFIAGIITHKKLMYGFLWAMYGVTVTFLVLFVVSIITPIVGEEKSSTFELVSINDTVATDGFFVVGIGYNDTDNEYVYYYRQADGSIKPQSVSAERVSFVETDESTKVVEHYTQCDAWYCLEGKYDRSYEFYVPKNSITGNYSFNNE